MCFIFFGTIDACVCVCAVSRYTVLCASEELGAGFAVCVCVWFGVVWCVRACVAVVLAVLSAASQAAAYQVELKNETVAASARRVGPELSRTLGWRALWLAGWLAGGFSLV